MQHCQVVCGGYAHTAQEAMIVGRVAHSGLFLSKNHKKNFFYYCYSKFQRYKHIFAGNSNARISFSSMLAFSAKVFTKIKIWEFRKISLAYKSLICRETTKKLIEKHFQIFYQNFLFMKCPTVPTTTTGIRVQRYCELPELLLSDNNIATICCSFMCGIAHALRREIENIKISKFSLNDHDFSTIWARNSNANIYRSINM